MTVGDLASAPTSVDVGGSVFESSGSTVGSSIIASSGSTVSASMLESSSSNVGGSTLESSDSKLLKTLFLSDLVLQLMTRSLCHLFSLKLGYSRCNKHVCHV